MITGTSCFLACLEWRRVAHPLCCSTIKLTVVRLVAFTAIKALRGLRIRPLPAATTIFMTRMSRCLSKLVVVAVRVVAAGKCGGEAVRRTNSALKLPILIRLWLLDFHRELFTLL